MGKDFVRTGANRAWSGTAFHGIAKPLQIFDFAQFRTEGCGEVAEPNRYALFLELR